MVQRLSGTNPIGKLLTRNETVVDAVQNSYYEVLNDTNIVVDGFGVGIVTNNETVNVRITIDGTVLTSTTVDLLAGGNAWSGAAGYGYMESGAFVPRWNAAAAVCAICGNTTWTGAWCKGRSVKIEVRKTTALGADSDIRFVAVYHKY